jgi:PII-like signaling protein
VSSAPDASANPPSTYRGQRVTFFFSARAADHHGSLLVHLFQRARRAKLAGATAFEAFEGYGESGGLHRHHALADDAPVMVIMVDRRDRIEAFLADLGDVADKMTITLSDVEVLANGAWAPPSTES